MGFRKAVAAEAFELAEGTFGKFAGVAVIEHALDELVLEFVDAAGEFERRHGAAKLIGFRR